MIVTLIAAVACLLAAFASGTRHLLSSHEINSWQTMSKTFRAITFGFSAVLLFLGLRLMFAATDGVDKIPPDASYGYAILAASVAVDRIGALVRLRQERQAFAVAQLNALGITAAFDDPPKGRRWFT